MSNTGKNIYELLTSTNLPAPKMTCPLKEIGNGNMLDGVKKIYGHGFSRGTVFGGVVVGSVFLLGYGVYELIKPHLTKNHLKTKSQGKTSKADKEDLQCQRRKESGYQQP